MKKLILSLCLGFMAFHFCNAKTLYVRPFPAGNDANNGLDSTTALQSIQTAVNRLNQSDQLIILKGNYTEKIVVQMLTNNPSGVEGNPTRITGQNGVNITHNPGVGKAIFTVYGDVKYIEISNIHLQNSDWFGFSVLEKVISPTDIRRPQNITLKNCSTLNTGASGLYAKGTDNVTFKNNIVDNACNDVKNLIDRTHECITVSNVNGFTIVGNEVKNGGSSTMGGEGIDAKSGSKNGVIKKNIVHDQVDQGIYIDPFGSIGENIEVSSNTVYKCAQGIYLSVEEGGTCNNISVVNNLVYQNRSDGIILKKNNVANGKPANFNNIKIINNTCYLNGGTQTGNPYGFGIIIDANLIKLNILEISNNICSQNLSAAMHMDSLSPNITNWTVNNNLSFPYVSNTVNKPNRMYGTSRVIADPLFDNAANLNFGLMQNSPAVDKGIAQPWILEDFLLKPRVSGARVDIGAIERINKAPTVTITSPSTGAIIYAPGSLTINAGATDADGTISSVAFYNGATLLGSDNSSPYSFTITNPTFGAYNLTAKATDGSGVITTSASVNGTYAHAQLGDGLTAYFYNNSVGVQNFNDANIFSSATRIDRQIDFTWPGSPASGIQPDNFGIKWKGKIKPLYSETYTFTTTSDDGVRLTLNGTVVIEKLVYQGSSSWTGSIALTADTKYDIDLKYFDGNGNANCKLEWSSTSTPKQIVPTSLLYSVNNSNQREEVAEIELRNKENSSVHPNPTTGVVQIPGWRTGEKVTILDAKGRTIMQSDISSTIWIGELPNGIYILMHEGKAHKIVKE